MLFLVVCGLHVDVPLILPVGGWWSPLGVCLPGQALEGIFDPEVCKKEARRGIGRHQEYIGDADSLLQQRFGSGNQ